MDAQQKLFSYLYPNKPFCDIGMDALVHEACIRMSIFDGREQVYRQWRSNMGDAEVCLNNRLSEKDAEIAKLRRKLNLLREKNHNLRRIIKAHTKN